PAYASIWLASGAVSPNPTILRTKARRDIRPTFTSAIKFRNCRSCLVWVMTLTLRESRPTVLFLAAFRAKYYRKSVARNTGLSVASRRSCPPRQDRIADVGQSNQHQHREQRILRSEIGMGRFVPLATRVLISALATPRNRHRGDTERHGQIGVGTRRRQHNVGLTRGLG